MEVSIDTFPKKNNNRINGALVVVEDNLTRPVRFSELPDKIHNLFIYCASNSNQKVNVIAFSFIKG
ncbi:hypothetical protein SAMN05216327_12710 [Dyadobacter sp. SG02]|uniref:hypothetical protein n=1 Tax=Dyadobacter sp. SG02 TaxID=1855291 RepID=UPI0008BBCFD4|nr:hypothetical protein [Dyadobacter sp. SG02]SEJ85526.1 hypothetical protein SAMN05216327_12710 [Dyadobacter sp. SG02]